MPTINSWNSNIPVEISKGGTNATSMTNTDGVCYFDGTRINTTTVGSAGQVLTSNGPAVAPTFQSGQVSVAKIVLTSQQIKSLHGTPITAIAAQGANTVVIPVCVSSRFFYNGNSYFTAGASQTIELFIGSYDLISVCFNQVLTGANTNHFGISVGPDGALFVSEADGIYDNQPLILKNPIATEISGNVQNDDSIIVSIFYTVANLT